MRLFIIALFCTLGLCLGCGSSEQAASTGAAAENSGTGAAGSGEACTLGTARINNCRLN
jgi:hypothetical protein